MAIAASDYRQIWSRAYETTSARTPTGGSTERDHSTPGGTRTARKCRLVFLRHLVELFEIAGREFQLGGGDVLFEVRDLRGPRDQQHHRRVVEQPGEGHLTRGRTNSVGDLPNWPSGSGQLADLQWIPGNEREVLG